MRLALFLAMALVSTTCGGLPDQVVLNGHADRLITEARESLRRNSWNSYFLDEINLDLVVLVNGMPQLGNFKANGGTLSDLASMTRSGDVGLVVKGETLELKVPLDFGKLSVKYNQYFFKFGWTTYVGGFTTVFNRTSASAVMSLSTAPCNVTISRASMDTFGQTSTNILKPPALVEKLGKVEEAVAGAFFRSLHVLEDFLKKGLKEAADRIDLCGLING